MSNKDQNIPMNDETNEPICTESRLNLFPIQYPDIWEMYKQSQAMYWLPEEVDLSSDLTDFEGLHANEQHFILMVLGFFANSDWIVNENLDTDFTSQIAIPELKMIYHFQEMMEDIHTNQYQLLIEVLVKDPIVKQELLQSTFTIPSIRSKADWCKKWISTGTFVQRLIAFSIVEGIFFSASFCSIFWIKKRGLMKGLSMSNQFIARDEGLHRDLAVLVYTRYIQNKLSSLIIKDMIRDAVSVEHQFVDACLPYQLTGMNKTLMKQYVEFVADHLCQELIGETCFNASNPFSWMSLISVETKTNFFEHKVSSYQRAAATSNKEENTINFDTDF